MTEITLQRVTRIEQRTEHYSGFQVQHIVVFTDNSESASVDLRMFSVGIPAFKRLAPYFHDASSKAWQQVAETEPITTNKTKKPANPYETEYGKPTPTAFGNRTGD